MPGAELRVLEWLKLLRRERLKYRVRLRMAAEADERLRLQPQQIGPRRAVGGRPDRGNRLRQCLVRRLRRRRCRVDIGFEQVALSLKGLAILNAIPDALKEEKATIGEKLRGALAPGSGIVLKEVVGYVLGALLRGEFRMS